MSLFFETLHEDKFSSARVCKLNFINSNRTVEVTTPIFMPVGTQGSVKGVWMDDLESIGYRLILANTYHLYLRPGADSIESLGGLKSFSGWGEHAVLTDSGGFQVFSLGDRVKFHHDGVEFKSHIDGSSHKFTPEIVIDTQRKFGSDIIMILDDCPPASADDERIQESLIRTHRWAERAYRYYTDQVDAGVMDSDVQKIFGIVQGGTSESKRLESLDRIQSFAWDGIALGGLSVGESREDFYRTLRFMEGKLDDKRPRYLMGVGTIPDFLEAISCGIDMFDCVLPTRNARNGQLLTSKGKVNIRNARYATDSSPVDERCSCRVCRRYSLAYLRHLFIAKEMAGPLLASYHNLHFFYDFMSRAREAIRNDNYTSFYKEWSSIPF